MLSDESSSDSETGRFKCRSKKTDDHVKGSNEKEDRFRSAGRSRLPESSRFNREFDKRREERHRYDRHPREGQRYSRHSPVRKRSSREREKSASQRSRESERHKYGGDSSHRSKPRESRDHRSGSRDRRRNSRSRSRKLPEPKRDLKEEIKRTLKEEIKVTISSREKSSEKVDKKTSNKSSSPDIKGKRSVIHKPTPVEPPHKKISEEPIVVEHGDSESSEEVQPGSYYSMIPAVVKEKSEESSEIDSSDDERLRAKLLNLEKELYKTRKKKHKKRHKRKSSKSSKDRDRDSCTVEVSSTTDIDKVLANETDVLTETAEVTSTQKSNQKESSEEGEISSDDNSQENIEIDPTDLRHKLKRSVPKVDTTKERSSLSKPDICGPALPPHLEKKLDGKSSQGFEGPALPSHLHRKSINLGPSIPEDLRKILAETEHEVIAYDSPEEDDGIGPLPAGTEDKWSEAHQRLEERALNMKIKKLEGHSLQNSDVKSREQWMLELPEAKAKYLGLEARSFRPKEGPDMSDRSSWTDTPEEKTRKAAGIIQEEDADRALQREARARQISNRDEEQERAIKKHKKKHKRDESLLDMHQKKLKKKKKKDEKEEDKKERRPFSRDVDLQVNRFDEAQKKSIIKKAQDLNTRFSRGEAKFL